MAEFFHPQLYLVVYAMMVWWCDGVMVCSRCPTTELKIRWKGREKRKEKEHAATATSREPMRLCSIRPYELQGAKLRCTKPVGEMFTLRLHGRLRHGGRYDVIKKVCPAA